MKNKTITALAMLLTPALAIAQESEESVNPIVGILLLIFLAILCVITWFIAKPLINLLVKIFEEIFEEPPSPDRKKKRLTVLITIVVLIFSSFVILGNINYDAEPNILLIIAALTSIMIIGTTLFWAPIMWLLGSFVYDRSWIDKKKISKTRYLVFVAFGVPLFSYIMIMLLSILCGVGLLIANE